MLEYKEFVEFKLLDEADTGGFEGYASLFGVKDGGGDIVEQGAFSDALDKFVSDGFISLGHNWDGLAIGTIAEAKEDRKGLHIRAQYHSTSVAQEARRVAQERMARGKSVGLSIGFGIEPSGIENDEDARHIVKVKTLFEVAQVNVPMLRPAGLTGIKGFGLPFDEHSERVRVAVQELIERITSGSDVRLKEGRAMSEARRVRISAVKESLIAGAGEIDALLLETEPRAKEVEPEVAKTTDPWLAEIHARFLELDGWHRALDGATR